MLKERLVRNDHGHHAPSRSTLFFVAVRPSADYYMFLCLLVTFFQAVGDMLKTLCSLFSSLGQLSLCMCPCVLVWLCKQWTLFPIPICYSVQKTKGMGAVQNVSIFHKLCWTSIFSYVSQFFMCLSQGFCYFLPWIVLITCLPG